MSRRFSNLPKHPVQDFDIFNNPSYYASLGEGFDAVSGPDGFAASVRKESRPISYLAKITALGANPTEYKASQVLPDGSAPSNPRVWDGEEGNLPVLNLIAGPHPNIGDIVRVHPGTDSSGQPFWWFISASPVLFPVKLTSGSGQNGTCESKASYTYNVSTLAGLQLGTDMTPLVARPTVGPVAQGGNGYGTAFYDGSTLHLWSAGEMTDFNDCFGLLGDEVWITVQPDEDEQNRIFHIGPSSPWNTFKLEAGNHITLGSADASLPFDVRGHAVMEGDKTVVIHHSGPAEPEHTVTIKGTGCLSGSGSLTFDGFGHYTQGDQTIEIELDTLPSGSGTDTVLKDITGFELSGSQLILKYRPATLNVKKNACGVVVDVSITFGDETWFAVDTQEQCP